MSAARDPEAIRAAAIAHLGARDARARRILSAARISTEPDDAAWESSGGDVRGVRVTLGVDPRTLGVVEGHPAIHDALGEALAAAIAGPGVAMTALAVRWSREHHAPRHAYRGPAPPDGAAGEASAEAIAEALVAFVEGAGEAELARELERASVTLRGPRRAEIGLRVARASERRRARTLAESALAALLPAWSVSVRLLGSARGG